MKSGFTKDVAHFAAMAPDKLATEIKQLEQLARTSQRLLAAARRAQKDHKRKRA